MLGLRERRKALLSGVRIPPQLLNNLTLGSKIKFGRYQVASETAQDIIWIIVAKAHSCTPAYPSNSITLISEKVIDLRCFDAAEPNNSDSNRQSSGNNRYSLSNIDQWLNKDSTAGAWYVATHTADQFPNSEYTINDTPYDTKAGFLHLFSANEKNAIQNTKIRTYRISTDGGSYEDITRKVFLPSRTEVGLQYDIAEGARWPFFEEASNRVTYLTEQAFNNTPTSMKPSALGDAWNWWLRTCNMFVPSTGCCIISDGTIYPCDVDSGAIGVRPALNLLSSLLVTGGPDANGAYTILL